MKKFWIVLLALGLVAAFAMSASAADVKFSGSYYVLGLYADKPSMNADASITPATAVNQAFYAQRLRVQTEFKVAEGLSLVTRFDALERVWGSNTWMGTGGDTYGRSSVGAAGALVQENIEFERAYLVFKTKIGMFQAGYLNFVSWGTEFHDTNLTRAGIKYIVPAGPLTIIAAIEKGQGGERNFGTGTASDNDNNVYDLGAIYKFSNGSAGLIYQKGINKTARVASNRWSDLNFILPYAKLKFGNFYVEGEGIIGFGDLRKFESGAGSDVSGSGYALYLHGKGDFGPAYAGARFVYLSGDDRSTTDKVEGSLQNALLSGDAFNPCLIMWNDDYTSFMGNIVTSASVGGVNPLTGTPAGMSTYMDNTFFYQIYGGFKPTKNLDIMMNVSYAYADKKPWIGATEFISDVYGTEVDLVAKYKIFDNLEYMFGGAYMWTGDLFKGTTAAFNVSNNYLLIHKLTLTF